jgi:arylsulfatase A-like enzyme
MDPALMQVSHADVTSPRLVAAFDRWLEQRRDGPFFAFVHMWDPHFDFVPPPPWDTKFDPGYEGPIDGRSFFVGPDHERYNASMAPRDLEHVIALYDGEIGWTDEHVGKILDGLERRGLLENTIVCVTSDHGTEFFEHGGKGHRRTLFEEVVRVPLILRWPAGVPAGARMRAQSRSIDVAPTLLDLAGLRLFPATYGQSLVPRFGGEPDQPPAAVCELFSVRNLRALRTGSWKFYEDLDRAERYWFDLEADPGEKRRFIDTSAESYVAHEQAYERERDRMQRHLARWPLPTARPEALPDDVLRSLQGYGYVGDDPDGDGDASAPGEKR